VTLAACDLIELRADDLRHGPTIFEHACRLGLLGSRNLGAQTVSVWPPWPLHRWGCFQCCRCVHLRKSLRCFVFATALFGTSKRLDSCRQSQPNWRKPNMMKTLIVAGTVLATSSAFAQTSTTSPGSSQNAPGQQMQNSTQPSTGPGASEYAPGHQKNTTGPGHSESAPGQQTGTSSPSTTGSGTSGSTGTRK
jgi:hypothetical protein